jgi:hypothetical protein
MNPRTRAEAPRVKAVQTSRALRWAMGLGLAAMAVIGVVLLFLLTQATNNRELYERNYGGCLSSMWWLGRAAAGDRLGDGAAAQRCAGASLAAACWSSWPPSLPWSAFAPGVLIYVVSYQFVSRSIESWFDVKVEGALDAGLSLGRATLDTLANDLSSKTRVAAQPAGRRARCIGWTGA